MPHRDDTRSESRLDPWEVVDLVGGFSVVALPLFVLAVPAVALLGYVLVPLAVIGLAVAIIVVPPLAAAKAIRARRRRSRDTAARHRRRAQPREAAPGRVTAGEAG